MNDPDSGLVYMQQRYYDPLAGRFLSLDQVLTDGNTGSSFNRYVYGLNNPYKYTDPDGRFIFLAAAVPYVVGAVTAAVAAHYAAPGRERRVQSMANGMRSLANAMNNESAETPKAEPKRDPPVPGAIEGDKSGGGTRTWTKPGGFDEANKDFDNKNPSNVSEKGSGVRVGTTEDGKRVIVRPDSSDGRPTIEIQRPDGKRAEDKIRYDN